MRSLSPNHGSRRILGGSGLRAHARQQSPIGRSIAYQLLNSDIPVSSPARLVRPGFPLAPGAQTGRHMRKRDRTARPAQASVVPLTLIWRAFRLDAQTGLATSVPQAGRACPAPARAPCLGVGLGFGDDRTVRPRTLSILSSRSPKDDLLAHAERDCRAIRASTPAEARTRGSARSATIGTHTYAHPQRRISRGHVLTQLEVRDRLARLGDHCFWPAWQWLGTAESITLRSESLAEPHVEDHRLERELVDVAVPSLS